MAVPSSGEISLLKIWSEKNENDYSSNNADGETDFSLLGMSSNSDDDSSNGNININTANSSSNRPDGDAPHSMSEWYAYDHDFNPFSSVIADFTISDAVIPSGTPGSPTTVLKTFTLAHGAGALTALFQNQNPELGTLALSISIEGDPGAGGTDNNATGYVSQGTQLSYSPTFSFTNTVSVRFRFAGHTSSANQTRTCTFTSNGQTDVVTITKNTAKSDRRLKTNIEMIGHSPSNIPIYIFNYKTDLNTKYKGVMAQDLLEMGITEPVVMGDDGFYGVDYSKIDVNMEIIS